MKRFDVVPEYGTVTSLYQVDSPDGEYVDADIAQEMYDMLKEISDWDGLPPYYQNKLEETLEKANED